MYTFKINFKDENTKIDIAQPFQFDSFSHSIEKDRGTFVTDLYIFAENTNLRFTNSSYTKTNQYEDIDGTIMFNLNHGLKRIIDVYEEYGPDAQISLEIYKNNLLFIECDFDLEEVDTDLLTYFECSFIENNKRSKFKLREDVIIDLYADKDLDDNTIVKMVPMKVLLKSKPKLSKSKWLKSDIPYSSGPGGVSNKFAAGSGYRFFNFNRATAVYEIEDTLVPSPFDYTNNYTDTYDGTMKIIDSRSTKNNVRIKVTSDIKHVHVQNGTSGFPNKSYLTLSVRHSYGTGIYDNDMYVLYHQEFTGTATQTGIVPNLIEFTFPKTLKDGEFISLFWEFYWDSGTIALSTNYADIDNYTRVEFNDCTVEMEAVETTINSVVQGNRLIDVTKKAAQITSGHAVDAPLYDVGGEYYNTLVLNGGGIRNIDNIPFKIKSSDIFDIGNMIAISHQVGEDIIRIGRYTDFYPNRLIKRFNVKPSEKLTWNTNKEYRIKTFDYKFENYEQDRDEKDTLDAVHTEIQLVLPNLKTKDSKQIRIKQICDAYKIDSLRRLGLDVNTKDSSLEDDTNLALLDIIPLSPTHIEYYTGLMNITSYTGSIKISVNKFKWTKLGLGLSSSFEIIGGSNAGTYTILQIEETVLTLQPLVVASNSSVSEIVEIKYTLENVLFVSRGNEGFSKVEGVLAPELYSNLKFSKLRNIVNWFPYLATCAMNYKNSAIKVSFLKSNQNLVTRLSTESVDLVEKDDIQISQIANLKRITNRKFNVVIFPSKEDNIVEIIKEINTRNSDGTIGGYFEFLSKENKIIKGYIDKFEYVPSENKLEAECLEKYEDDTFNILTSDRALYSQFEIFGIYVSLYDVNGILLFSKKRFTKIKIDGISYGDVNIFNNDLQQYFS